MDTDIVKSLTAQIDRYTAGQPTGTLESQSLDSLCSRILAPPDIVRLLIAEGLLRPTGQAHANANGDTYTFASDNLNKIRSAILQALVEKIVESSSGDPDEIAIAGHQALNEHVKNFSAKPGKVRELSRYDGRPDDDEPGPLQRTAATVGKVAAVGAAAYGGAAWLRGRRLQPGASLIDQMKAGSAANIATARSVAGNIGAGAAKVAAILKGKRPPLAV